jgi:hypothetical protein
MKSSKAVATQILDALLLSSRRAILNGGTPSVDGEFRAVNETRTIGRQEDNGLGNLVRCSRTTRRRLGG